MEVTEAELAKRNYVLVFDRSGSMQRLAKANEPASGSRWEAIRELAMEAAELAASLDDDGIDVYLFNGEFTYFPNCTPDKVKEIFDKESPMGGTDFLPVLKHAVNQHFTFSKKPTSIITITDGEPQGGPAAQKALARFIVETAKRLEDRSELGFAFWQIGDDAAASAFLKKLDDDLPGMDIVDCKTFEFFNKNPMIEAFKQIITD